MTTIRRRQRPAPAPPRFGRRQMVSNPGARCTQRGCQAGPIPHPQRQFRIRDVCVSTGLPPAGEPGRDRHACGAPETASGAFSGLWGVHPGTPGTACKAVSAPVLGDFRRRVGFIRACAHRSAAGRALVRSLPPAAAERWVLQGSRSPASATARIASPRCAPPCSVKACM